MPGRKPSRTSSKRDKNLPALPARSRPGLAVNTSFSRHYSNPPEQIFPRRPSPKREQTLHNRIQGLRPTPLNLNIEVSPSDSIIPIGLAIPSAALSNHTQSPRTIGPYPDSPPPRYGYELTTPTIVITPAKEDFEIKSSGSSASSERRPTSSLYSRYTHGPSNVQPPNQRTPPVPPLPRFAADSNASLRLPSRRPRKANINNDQLTSRGRDGLSIRTVSEEQDEVASRAVFPIERSNRASSQYVPTPRRSKGWWNVLTSPFSAKSAAFSFRSSPGEDDEYLEHEPILSSASEMGHTKHLLHSGQDEDGGVRSAPAIDRPIQNFSSRELVRTPKRSDTAPGAIDPGNAADVNIYRASDDGEASSYYDSTRSFPSMVGTKASGRPRALEDVGDFDPRDSCYQPSRDIGVAVGSEAEESANSERGIRDSEFYRVPSDGEAAEYYDSNRTFPSLVPFGFQYGDKAMKDWSPRRSVSRELSNLDSSTTHFTESPSDIASADLDKAVPSGQAQVVERSPFDSGHAAEFEGFSTAYGPSERKFFSTPSTDEMNGRTPPALIVYNTADRQVQSPMSDATPVLEDAHTVTYMGPTTANAELREVDVESTRTPTPDPAAPYNGLGAATMSTSNARVAASNPEPMPMPMPMPMPEKPPYPISHHTRNDSYGLGISDDESAKGLFPPPSILNEKSDAASEYPGELPRRRERSSCRYLCCLATFISGILLALLIVLCVFFIPFPHVDVPVQAEWLNLTGFPALPIGISTIIGPKAVQQVSGCVSQEQLWTCSMPARDLDMATPNQPDEPNFRFEIRFRNNTVPANETVPVTSNSTLYKRSAGQAAQAGALVRRTARTNLLFSSWPAPPSTDDQEFIGRITDHNSAPFDGEETPFYISLLEAAALKSNDIPGLQKRDQSQSFHYPYPTTSTTAPSGTAPSSASVTSTVSTTFASGPTDVPQPAMRSDGRPAPAMLYPFAYAQPLRLFDRGQDSEHYGFYTYYDRSMYLSVRSTTNSSSLSGSITPNVQLESANAVCTWSQTRLRFQIWTQKAGATSLSGSQSTSTPLMQSSANDMTAPGSFPYAVTVTLDRHGGEAGKKGVYCYSLNGEQQVTDTVRTWIAENRSFDGQLVNPAAVPMNNGTTLTKRIDSSGIDGGSGGCACQWQNWE